MASEILEKSPTEMNELDVTESEGVAESEDLELEEEDICFQDVELLSQHGVSGVDILSLKKAGINTIKGVQMAVRKKLLSVNGFDSAKIDKIKELCCKITLANAFVTASELSFQRKQIFKLSTGSKALDKLLGGGVEAMSITEVFGEFRTGKTQISHTLCVTTQLPGPNGYIGGKVFYIDTEHTFRPDRLRLIAERFNLDQNAVLDNVLYARAYNSEHQFELLNSVAAKLHEDAGVFKLLIVDSVMALFRVDFSGRGEMFDRQHKLALMMSRLQKISEEYNIAVFITNQITSDFQNPQNLTRPIGGNVLAHASTTRVALTKGDGPLRFARLLDSPDQEEAEIAFAITGGGIDDLRN